MKSSLNEDETANRYDLNLIFSSDMNLTRRDIFPHNMKSHRRSDCGGNQSELWLPVDGKIVVRKCEEKVKINLDENRRCQMLNDCGGSESELWNRC